MQILQTMEIQLLTLFLFLSDNIPAVIPIAVCVI